MIEKKEYYWASHSLSCGLIVVAGFDNYYLFIIILFHSKQWYLAALSSTDIFVENFSSFKVMWTSFSRVFENFGKNKLKMTKLSEKNYALISFV